MIDILPIFKNRKPDKEKLQEEGFLETEEGFVKDCPIMKGEYTAKIYVSPEGKVDFRAFEAESGDEYLPAHVFNAKGSLVGVIHGECEKILKEVSARCFYTEIYRWDQSKRILEIIREKYGAEPEFLWKKFPEYGAIRVPGKEPWFGLIGRVPKSKLGLEEDGMAEVINLKDEPELVKERIKEGKVLPAYHMNKQHWYSLILDDHLSDEEVVQMIEKSFSLVD